MYTWKKKLYIPLLSILIPKMPARCLKKDVKYGGETEYDEIRRILSRNHGLDVSDRMLSNDLKGLGQDVHIWVELRGGRRWRYVILLLCSWSLKSLLLRVLAINAIGSSCFSSHDHAMVVFNSSTLAPVQPGAPSDPITLPASILIDANRRFEPESRCAGHLNSWIPSVPYDYTSGHAEVISRKCLTTITASPMMHRWETGASYIFTRSYVSLIRLLNPL